jgi:uncharacterized membrane-anchored protein
MKYIFIGAFVVMICAQWAVPLSMIKDANETIDEGVEYKFKTAPIDPSDPFRGKYITLSYDQERYYPADTIETRFPQSSMVYALLGQDSAGYAKITKLVDEPPLTDVDYVAVTFNYGYASIDSYVDLSFPFSTFYVEESKASQAEQLYWRNRGDSAVDCYAKVRVRNGDAKLVDVIFNDSSIVDVVRRLNKGNEANKN